MNIKKIQELIELMNNNNLGEIEIEQEGQKVKLKKTTAQGIIEQAVSQAAALQQPQAAAAAPAKPKEAAGNLKEVKAPMVGTFYRSPSPDSEAYVDVGKVVHKGDVLCIIEAMKIMNEVKSEFDGKIVQIPVENAEPIEFGQTLFLIEPI